METPVLAPLPSPDDIDTAATLLGRIDELLMRSRGGVDGGDLKSVGTSGKSAASAKVEVDVATLDEIRAEVAQVRGLLKKPQ
jgi:hypothetical protein